MSDASIAPHAHVKGEERAKLGAKVTKLYQKGATIRQLAASTGRSYGFTHSLLRESGAELRAHGGNNRPKTRRVTKG